MKHSETIGKIAGAMVKAQTEMANASKSSKNPFFKSNYASFNEVRESSLPALNANGIAVFQTAAHVDGRVEVETILVHESGEWISGTVSLKPKVDDPQGAGSAITYGRRYGLSAICALGAEDDDGERSMNRKQAPPLQKQVIIGQENINWLSRFCKTHDIKDKQILMSKYSFDPYGTTAEQFEPIKRTMESDYQEAAA